MALEWVMQVDGAIEGRLDVFKMRAEIPYERTLSHVGLHKFYLVR